MPKLFAGLDVADQTTAICVLDGAGRIVCQRSVATTPAAITVALRPHRRLLAAVGQETGTKAVWLHKELSRRAFPMLCLDARHVQAALSAKPNKTDKNDAKGIATLLRRGVFTTAHVKTDESIRIRLLLATRRTLQRKALDLQGSIRMALKTFGAGIESKRRRLVVRLSVKTADHMLSNLVRVMMDASDNLMAEVAILDRLIVKMAAADPVCRRLMTIPGVGPITALAFRAAVDDPARFTTSRTVAAYFGLTPRRFQSGQTNLSGHISRYGDSQVRATLYSAASSLLNTSRSQCSLRLWGLKLAEKKGFKLAAVACARKLAVVMHKMWVTGGEFEPQRAMQTRRPPGRTISAPSKKASHMERAQRS